MVSLGLAAGAWLPLGAQAATEPTILVVGDSLSAEYGLARGHGWVALMQQRLDQKRLAAKVVNASISGDTTSGGRSRLAPLLAQYKPAIVILELGGNDALRGLPLDGTRANLASMAAASKAAGAQVIVVGMQVPPNYGRQYSEQFAGLFASVAKSENASLVPFMLEGVADAADFASRFQPDGIHPNQAQHPRILDNIWPSVEHLLRGH